MRRTVTAARRARSRSLVRSLTTGSALLAGLILLAPAALAYAAPTGAAAPATAPAVERPEPGDASMGWRHRSQSDQDTDSGLARASVPPLKPMTGVLGIDVSAYQPTVDWRGFRAKNRVFAYIKATEGTSYKNKYFARQWSGSLSAGFIRGAYHFANPGGKSGRAQATYFVANGGRWVADGKTLPGVLDIEYSPYRGDNMCFNRSKTQMVGWIADFTTTYKALTGRDAVIYTTASWWKACTGNTTRFSRTNPLWVARWSDSPGTLPGSWPFYTFWQYSSKHIDQNKFSATYARLQVLARGK